MGTSKKYVLPDCGVAAISAMLINYFCELRFSKAPRFTLEQKF